MAPRGKCPSRSATTTTQPCSSDLYRCHKRRLVRSLRRSHRKRDFVTPRKSKLHINLLDLKGVFLVLKRVQRPLFKQDCTHSNRQHHSCCLRKQGRRHEVGPAVCPTVENPDLVLQQAGDSQSSTHSRPAKCGSTQATQARSNNPNRVVSPYRGLPVDMHQMASTT